MDTRTKILEKNYEAMRLHGFQGTRADKVIKELGITKGALYHYFPNKMELGYAIVEEMIAPQYIRMWKSALEEEGHPISILQSKLDYLQSLQCQKEIEVGCILNNLMQEMSPLDEGFRTRLEHILQSMRSAIESLLLKGQQNQQIDEKVNPAAAATFFVASLEGSFGIAKNAQDPAVLNQCFEQLKHYVESLRK